MPKGAYAPLWPPPSWARALNGYFARRLSSTRLRTGKVEHAFSCNHSSTNLLATPLQLPCEYAFIFVRGFQAAVTEAYPGTAVRQQERHTTTDITPKTLTRSRSATPLPFHTRGHGRASDVLIRAPIAFLPPSSRSSRSREPWRPSTLCPPPRG